MFYFARCINITFNSLLAQLAKYDVYTHSQNKIHTRQFLSHIIILQNILVCFFSFFILNRVYIAQVFLHNALSLSNICEYRHK